MYSVDECLHGGGVVVPFTEKASVVIASAHVVVRMAALVTAESSDCTGKGYTVVNQYPLCAQAVGSAEHGACLRHLLLIVCHRPAGHTSYRHQNKRQHYA
ncbi:MAG: hypothetical protein IJ621_04485 [Paludibacteraceae bacterium]|nr:hypothetical protein [Paludibacteraceae bacterium]